MLLCTTICFSLNVFGCTKMVCTNGLLLLYPHSLDANGLLAARWWSFELAVIFWVQYFRLPTSGFCYSPDLTLCR